MWRGRVQPSSPSGCLAVIAGITVFTAFMVMARLVLGVHLLTDIIGGVLLGAGLVGISWSFCLGQAIIPPYGGLLNVRSYKLVGVGVLDNPTAKRQFGMLSGKYCAFSGDVKDAVPYDLDF